MLRVLVLALFLAGLAYWLNGEQQQGRLRQVDEIFLDFLLANTRQDIKPIASQADRFVFVSFREEDKAEYEAWPPAPIDWQMLLKTLAEREPAALIIAAPLTWPDPKPPFIDQVADQLVHFPSAVLAGEAASEDQAGGVEIAQIKDKLPTLERVQGPVEALPALANLTALPEDALIRHADLGVRLSDHAVVAVRMEQRVVPTFELQALVHATRTPFSRLRLILAPGAGLHLGDLRFVPLNSNGGLMFNDLPITEINALDVISAAASGDDLPAANALTEAKVMVIGIGDEATRLRVRSIAAALAIPQLRELRFIEQVGVWLLVGLLSLSILSVRRQHAFWRTLLLLVVALAASYLAFQSNRLWCPPAIPAAMLLFGGLYTRLFGRSTLQPAVDSTPATS